MAEYRIRWAKVTGPWKDGRRRMCIAERKVRLFYLLPVWWPVEHGNWRSSEADCQKDIDFDGKFRRPLPATVTVPTEFSEAQQQAQAALDKAMNCRCDAFDRGAVFHWAERGLYQVKADPAPQTREVGSS